MADKKGSFNVHLFPIFRVTVSAKGKTPQEAETEAMEELKDFFQKLSQGLEIGMHTLVFADDFSAAKIDALNDAGEVIATVDLGDDDEMFDIEYKCPECGHEWNERWSCACDSECPNCGLKNIQAL